jgi:hypothetical protein
MKHRLRSKDDKTLQERLNEQAQRLRREAAKTPPGTARDMLLHRAIQAEATSRLDGWLASSELRPPR